MREQTIVAKTKSPKAHLTFVRLAGSGVHAIKQSVYCSCVSVGRYIAAAAVPSLKGRANCRWGGKGDSEGLRSQQLHNE
jgi:hypothetical protein